MQRVERQSTSATAMARVSEIGEASIGLLLRPKTFLLQHDRRNHRSIVSQALAMNAEGICADRTGPRGHGCTQMATGTRSSGKIRGNGDRRGENRDRRRFPQFFRAAMHALKGVKPGRTDHFLGLSSTNHTKHEKSPSVPFLPFFMDVNFCLMPSRVHYHAPHPSEMLTA
jgi:hypothetical protein